MQRWFLWLDQLKDAGTKGVLAHDSMVRDPDKCTKVLRDKGYEISYRVVAGQSLYTLVAEPLPYESKVSTFPGDLPEVDDSQGQLF